MWPVHFGTVWIRRERVSHPRLSEFFGPIRGATIPQADFNVLARGLWTAREAHNALNECDEVGFSAAGVMHLIRTGRPTGEARPNFSAPPNEVIQAGIGLTLPPLQQVRAHPFHGFAGRDFDINESLQKRLLAEMNA